MSLRYDPLPAFWVGFHRGGLVRYSLYGVNVFVLGVVEIVGYRPTGSSKEEKGTTPGTKHPCKTGTYKPTAMKPTQQNNPALKGKACPCVNMQR